ncbi:MAG: hypothetical protein KGZ57_00865 [Dethiobacter sp.]|nr:hypothetical protein [Dethiobacter sp.]
METRAKNTDTALRDGDLDEELAGILTAISVVSKRLAKKLLALQRRDESAGEGGVSDGKDE